MAARRQVTTAQLGKWPKATKATILDAACSGGEAEAAQLLRHPRVRLTAEQQCGPLRPRADLDDAVRPRW